MKEIWLAAAEIIITKIPVIMHLKWLNIDVTMSDAFKISGILSEHNHVLTLRCSFNQNICLPWYLWYVASMISKLIYNLNISYK